MSLSSKVANRVASSMTTLNWYWMEFSWVNEENNVECVGDILWSRGTPGVAQIMPQMLKLLLASQPLFRSLPLPNTAQEISEGLAQWTGDDFPPFLPIETDQASESRHPKGLKGDTRKVDQRALMSPRKATSLLFLLVGPKTGLLKWKAGSVRCTPLILQHDVAQGYQPAGFSQLGPCHQ